MAFHYKRECRIKHGINTLFVDNLSLSSADAGTIVSVSICTDECPSMLENVQNLLCLHNRKIQTSSAFTKTQLAAFVFICVFATIYCVPVTPSFHTNDESAESDEMKDPVKPGEIKPIPASIITTTKEIIKPTTTKEIIKPTTTKEIIKPTTTKEIIKPTTTKEIIQSTTTPKTTPKTEHSQPPDNEIKSNVIFNLKDVLIRKFERKQLQKILNNYRKEHKNETGVDIGHLTILDYYEYEDTENIYFVKVIDIKGKYHHLKVSKPYELLPIGTVIDIKPVKDANEELNPF
ncbi:hypothetical protein GJ496_010869 [Pomphorhynchus laevis]|nr:hypothetical protein GJ496_010869 [Pomphorhynchus laevis]